MSQQFNELVGNAILGIDTLWGGDVLCASGTGRFIADSWFSDEPLPVAYTHASAAAVRQSGGVAASRPNLAAIESYLADVDVRGSIRGLIEEASAMPGSRGEYVRGLALCFETMWDLALEILGAGEPVPYTRCVEASTGRKPEPSRPEAKRERVAELLSRAGHTSGSNTELLAAVDAWRRARMVPMASVRALGDAVIARFDALSAANLLAYLPPEFAGVPRANIQFLPIQDAWFSGSMNYLGRARRADGSPEYEATYEINAALQISVPEFMQLVSHEVVPGHVTTFAYLQNLYARGVVGFEASVLTMNTRAAALFEGIANNAILMAHGITEVEELPDEDLQIGVLLALLQDDAKNQSSFLTWGEGMSRPEVAAVLRRDFLVSAERADKLSGAWGGTRCWAGCICRLIGRAPRRWRNCDAVTRRETLCPLSTVAVVLWILQPLRRPRPGLDSERGSGAPETASRLAVGNPFSRPWEGALSHWSIGGASVVFPLAPERPTS